MKEVTFVNNQLWVNEELYHILLDKYGYEDYKDNKIAVKTNNSFASRTVVEYMGDKWYKFIPISSQNNERPSLQLELYWTLLKEFDDIKFEGNIPTFYKQWFMNRGLLKENKMKINEISLPKGWKGAGKDKWIHPATKFTIFIEKVPMSAKTPVYSIVGQAKGYPASEIHDDWFPYKTAIKVAVDTIKTDYPNGNIHGESKMNEQKLSKLQIAYREFFKALMDEFGVKSPVQLGDKRSEFFNRVKKEWPAAKKKIQEGVLRQTIRNMIVEVMDNLNVAVEPIETGGKTKTHHKRIGENLDLKNGTKVLYINNKNKLVPATIKDEVGHNQYQIQDDKEGNTQVLKKGKKAKQGVYFQVNEAVIKEDEIPGGKGDDTDAMSVDKQELEVGVAVEKEHTDNPELAAEIAMDHLAEKENYYSELVKSGIVDESEALKLAKKFGWVTENKLTEDVYKTLTTKEWLSIPGIDKFIRSKGGKKLKDKGDWEATYKLGNSFYGVSRKKDYFKVVEA